MLTQSHNARTLIFSLRNIFRSALFRCPLYEFERVISEIDSVDLLAPPVDLSNRHHRFAKRLAFHAPITLNPGLPTIQMKNRYDLFFTICGAPADLLFVNAIGNWRNFCKTSVCLLDELWIKEMANYRHFLNILSNFDIIFLYYSKTVSVLSEQIRRKCVYLPPGVDTMLFCPYPAAHNRVVDVYSAGRRSQVTHQATLKMAAEQGMLYLFDTIAGDQAIAATEHRAQFANLARLSRYFIVNPGLIDRPETRGDQIEIGNRYFEGAASGAILLGERPDTADFANLFDWPDALIHLPYNSDNIERVITDLDQQPARQEKIRRTNVVQSLMRNDWAYRWEAILKTVGIDPMPSLLQRKERLRETADFVRRDGERSCGALSVSGLADSSHVGRA